MHDVGAGDGAALAVDHGQPLAALVAEADLAAVDRGIGDHDEGVEHTARLAQFAQDRQQFVGCDAGAPFAVGHLLLDDPVQRLDDRQRRMQSLDRHRRGQRHGANIGQRQIGVDRAGAENLLNIGEGHSVQVARLVAGILDRAGRTADPLRQLAVGQAMGLLDAPHDGGDRFPIDAVR